MTSRHRVTAPDVDVVVVGAGFAGLYTVYRLRAEHYTVRVFDAAGDLGGTWYWNRYPGARVDIPSVDYMFSFDPDWRRDWQWSEKYATQPEILRYLNHVADKFDLRRDIQFRTRVTQARWDHRSLWRVRTDRDDDITCRFIVMATGCLSTPKEVDIDGVERFGGDVYFTSRWPHDRVDFTGNGWRSSGPAPQASSRFRPSPGRRGSLSCSSAPRTSRSPPTTVHSRRRSSHNWPRTRRHTATRRGSPEAACRWSAA